jgi:hypothetical protein
MFNQSNIVLRGPTSVAFRDTSSPRKARVGG